MTPGASAPVAREVVFISKATPGDDEFALWLAPRLEAMGYVVFADILAIEPGDRWRKRITDTLQSRSVKMLLCCRDSTLRSDGVQEEIGIATDLARELNDPRFIIPLRLEPFKKLFGIGELQYIDFVRGWAQGLDKLVRALKHRNVPCDTTKVQINPNWEIYRRRGAKPIRNEPERLTSNWLRVADAPDLIRYFEPTGSVDHAALAASCRNGEFASELHRKGFLSFCTHSEISEIHGTFGKFDVVREVPLSVFINHGLNDCGIRSQEARNFVISMFRKAWNSYCRNKGLLEHKYSKDLGFHASKDHVKLGQRVPWGKQGDRRSSMLRNLAKGTVWQFGVTGLPALWPYPHFKLKSRVLFAPLNGVEAGDPFEDTKKQHRMRRSNCKGWRNKQWHGRLSAYIELLSGESSYISLPLSNSAFVKLDAAPVLFSSPVSTDLPSMTSYEEEEQDISTLGRPVLEEDS